MTMFTQLENNHSVNTECDFNAVSTEKIHKASFIVHFEQHVATVMVVTGCNRSYGKI